MASYFIKQPAEVLDYDVDMSDWLTTGDDIDSVTYTVEAFGEDAPQLEIGPTPHEDIALLGAEPVRFKIWVGGGTDNVDYKITLLVVTEQARKKEIELQIGVRDQ